MPSFSKKLLRKTYDLNILVNCFNLLKSLKNIVVHSEKIDIIIGIGDSPAIFLQILKIFRKSYVVKYLPISGLTAINKKNNKLKEKLKKLPNVGNILWVDFVNTGNTFKTFYINLPNEIKKKSKFFLYGSIQYDFYKKYKNNKKVYFYFVDRESIFYTFLAHLIGDAEKHNIRCVNHKKVNNKYNVKLVDNKEFNEKYCKKFAKWLHSELVKENYII